MNEDKSTSGTKRMSLKFRLERPSSLAAWEILQAQPSGSRNDFVMQAIIQYGNVNAIEEAVSRGVSQALADKSFVTRESTGCSEVLPENDASTTNDEHMDAALAFLDTLMQ